ncbi:MAG: chromosome segregation protein SMC [Eubacteriales bacterium]|nr:chromosome segregation protein SMC [Eubacteriales bacterium]
MYLKSIEIQGFKSFAHKTLLQFNNGVTGIVGPNGSGKSNISDAVRWVLGEQKVKQLRGSAMQDVIFAGTELRKAQGFAFVSITLDNSDKVLPVDYTEVTVSRKLFRSGESDYMINGQSVRLKDIQELFYDTGIGREGYSIIGQGQIDAIINGRPRDRRGLFDEAAGIVKFKKRKAAAVKRLESEHESLLRVTDIINELEKRLHPLERQAEGAKNYLKLREEQKKLDINLFIRQADAILDTLEKSKANLDIVKASLEETQAESERLKASGSALAEQLNEIDAKIEAGKDESSKAELLKENLSGQVNVYEAKIKADTDNAERLSDNINRLRKSLEESKATAYKYLNSIDELANSLELMDKGNEDDELASDFADTFVLSSKLEGFRTRLSEVGINTDTVSDTDNTPKGADSVNKGASEAVNESEEAEEDNDDEDISFTLPSWMQAIRNKRDDLAEIREKEERTTEWLNKATDEYNLLTGALKRLEAELNNAQGRYASLNARLESIRNLAERYEGYGESIRAVMREKSHIHGIKGVVADLISTDKRYETAVETALGGRIQNIVTETEDSAKNCIEFLKRTRQGRATFLPLDSIRYKEQQELKSAVREPGAIGIASKIVNTADEYEVLAEYLLGNILVADNIDSALAIARKYRHSLRIVTLDGEQLSPGGSLSGGAYKNSSKLMGRSREISELEQNVEAAKRDITAVRDKISEQDKLIAEKSAEIDKLNEELKLISNEKNEISYGITSDIRLRFSELKQRIGFVGENIERIASDIVRQRADMEAAEREALDCERRISDAKQYISERNADIEHIESELKQLKADIEALISERSELTGKQSGYASQKDEYAASILELQKDILRLENQVEKEQQKLDDETEYIWNEYELSITSAKEFMDESLGPVSSIKSELASVKSRIKALGPVNVQAIEEYKEVSERYGFMKTQYDDLVASEASIAGIIEELDIGMKKQFDKQFAAIKEQFRSVFRELFGGGEADLDLVYDHENEDADAKDDELEAGISIVVQPPGKKLQSIMQLSGGEKALTAIALMFAIQNLKPSPFCLLDEIEAALDDSNVSRFANYLHKLTEHTQFIVITHRRGTMEAADRLYGVTMQEKGISKLVSVDLISDQLS